MHVVFEMEKVTDFDYHVSAPPALDRGGNLLAISINGEITRTRGIVDVSLLGPEMIGCGDYSATSFCVVKCDTIVCCDLTRRRICMYRKSLAGLEYGSQETYVYRNP